jgi:phage N-6-adenine-methyltransferase
MTSSHPQEKNTDSYMSPEWILKMFEDYQDVCPINDNPEVDALKLDWANKIYVNPPYSNPLPWIEKAIEEANKGKVIVMMLKVDTSTKWFRRIIESKAHILWLNGRIKYRRMDYKYHKPTPVSFPVMLVTFYNEVEEW